MPVGRAMVTIDERLVRAPLRVIFDLVRQVEHWPAYLAHYRYVRFREQASDGGGIVEMSANRPFGLFNWPLLPVERSRDLAGAFMDWHKAGVKVLYVLLALHVLAALKHHFVDRDNVLHRMIPLIPRRP